MHIKFLKHGSGSCKKAADYLTQEKDHTGEERERIAVLRGDPQAVAAVADSLDFTRKYSSAVIAWAPEDKPEPEEIDAVLDDFISMATAGLSQDRVSLTAVQHDEKNGGKHIHVLIARTDLATGKAFNPAPPSWKYAYDPIRDFYNYNKGWARPDDPARAKAVQYESVSTLPAQAKEAKALIGEYTLNAINDGLIKDRADMVTFLKDRVGEITRESEHFISVKPEGFKKPLRLKGGIYERDFNASPQRSLESEGERGFGANHSSDQYRAKAALNRFEKALHRRTEYNQKRYGSGDKEFQSDHQEIQFKDPDPDHDDSFRRNLGAGPGELWPHELSGVENQGEFREIERVEETARSLRHNQGLADSTFQSGKWFWPNSNQERAVSMASKGREVGHRPEITKTEVQTYMKNSNTEIERFKTEIDLSRYLETQGYQKDRYASCRSSAVLYNGPDEKLVVGKQAGHFVYTNTKDPQDQGSIIDFIQRRQGLNLGQIRKSLRPALVGDYAPRHDWKPPAYAVDKAQDRWVKGREVFDFAYLKGRGIDPATVKAYSPAIRQDPRTKDLMFLHRGQQGFSGYEVKGPVENKGRFAAGGDKTFFPLQQAGADPVSRVVVTETALDALSYAQMEGCRKDTAYVSMAGNPSEDQLGQLRSLCGQPMVQSVVLAHDKDKGGNDQADKCREALAESPAKVERETPAAGKDWNELLQFKIKQDLELKESIKRQLAAKKAAEKAQERQRSRGQGHGISM